MDIEDEEVIQLWKLFQQHRVRYIMIGGFATNFHGYSRFTADLDVWIFDSQDNRKNLVNSLREFGMILPDGFEKTDFVPGWSTIHLNSGMQLDIMTYMKGIAQEKFDECYSLAAEADIHGVTVRFLHLNHLLEAKLASGLPKDLLDIEELERLYKGK